MRRLLLALMLMPTTVFAENTVSFGCKVGIGEITLTSLTLTDTTKPGAVAELQYDNRSVNYMCDNGTFELTHNGLTIQVMFTWTSGADLIEVTVPEGYIAYPDSLSLGEGEAGLLYIYSDKSVGM
jgi:hypothetical protein